MDEIVNRVAASALVTLDLDKLYRNGPRAVLDIAPALENGLLLREKSFREFVQKLDAGFFQGKFVAVTCSVDALIPAWAWMLVTSALEPVAGYVSLGTVENLEERLLLDALNTVDWQRYRDAKVLVKGCSNVEVPPSVYAEATRRLRPVAQSIMYGEACSAVPVFKRK